ncbi:nucleotide exchange factor GrpE [Thermaurantiacus sp.]
MNEETTDATEEHPLEEQLRLAREEIVALTAARDFERDQALRAIAEAQNTRARLEREKSDAIAYAAAAFARDMLVVADNLERALAALPAPGDEALKSVVAGLEAVQREMLQVFERHGITRVETVGLPLDPMSHQAMVEVESDSEPGTVVAELQAGYRMKDRLLRPALVSVARKREEAA